MQDSQLTNGQQDSNCGAAQCGKDGVVLCFGELLSPEYVPMEI